MRQIYCIFSDESGVFDNQHGERYFVYGGLILDAGKDEVSKVSSVYKQIENYQ